MKKRLYSVLLLVLILLLSTLNIGCPIADLSTAELAAIDDFLIITDFIIDDTIELGLGVISMASNQGMPSKYIVAEYKRVINEYINLEYTYSIRSFPKQCSLLRDLTKEVLYYYIEESSEMIMFLESGDNHHMEIAYLHFQTRQDFTYAVFAERDKIANKYLEDFIRY